MPGRRVSGATRFSTAGENTAPVCRGAALGHGFPETGRAGGSYPLYAQVFPDPDRAVARGSAARPDGVREGEVLEPAQEPGSLREPGSGAYPSRLSSPGGRRPFIFASTFA